ncbi:helix-turn-helix domain-containing protein [Actinomadura yumaensis]
MVRRAATAPVRPAAPAATARIAERARRRLHDAPLDDVPADELARAAGCSRFALYRAFQKAHGMSPSDYQRQLRLRAARALLASGEPIGDVAAGTGFADQSHLTRWFVRYFGVTPGAFRRAHAEQ